MKGTEMTEPDHRRFLAHFLSHRDSLYAFLLVLVRDRALAEDLFQETSLVLWEKFGEFREGTHFGAWSRQIAYHLVRNARRRLSRRRRLLPEVAAEAVSRALARQEETADEERWRRALKECLDRLAPAARELIRKRYFQDLPVKEIAQVLGRTTPGVRSALGKIRAALEVCLRRTVGRVTIDV